MAKKKQRNYWKIALISILAFWVLTFLFSLFKNSDNESNQNVISAEQSKIQKLETIVQDYSQTHTYSLVDLFVCTDTSIDIWNLVKTEGINAQICVGNVEENLSESDKILNDMNHAWVLAETESFKWVALETTRGYLVWGTNKSQEGIENDLYYHGLCFDNPSEFKSFLKLRDNYFETCNEAQALIDFWNENYVGKILTAGAYEFKGRMETKREECNNINNQLVGLLS